MRSPVQDKNFYLLSLIESTTNIAKLLAADPELAALAKNKIGSETDCSSRPVSCVDSAVFSPEETERVRLRLVQELRSHPALKLKTIVEMRKSGLFSLYSSDDDAELLSHAWVDAAHGINRILAVYGTGQAPRYPKIDSASVDIESPVARKVLADYSAQISATNVDSSTTRTELWFQPSLKLALLLLQLNNREEAGRFEPLEDGENAAPLARMPHVDWKLYQYSAIVVPGLGPEETGVALDPGGFRRIALAAKNYHEGLAPFILVTGGYVHPSQTPYCEAIEMKKALIRDLRIPSEAIIVEPQARHTTTNLRDATRLLYRYGVSLDLPALITTDEAQTSNIRSTEFAKRNQEELGYLPFRNLRSISSTETAFTLELDSLQANSSDPLDP